MTLEGQYIEMKRREAGIPKAELSRRARIDQKWLYRSLTGDRLFKPDELLFLMNYFNISVQELRDFINAGSTD